ncbi:MAG: DUF86 domain-containing protein [Burkholderiales bacterium]|nr:DUF86 domain-containing protein [Burkholderiales bacterium]
MQPDDRVRLLHMVEAAETAAAFVAGRARADLDTDRMLLFAVVRAIEVVGEAANHVSPACRALLPGLPWLAIVGMRHRIVHAYFQIDADTVWKTATEELPALRSAVQAALDAR